MREHIRLVQLPRSKTDLGLLLGDMREQSPSGTAVRGRATRLLANPDYRVGGQLSMQALHVLRPEMVNKMAEVSWKEFASQVLARHPLLD